MKRFIWVIAVLILSSGIRLFGSTDSLTLDFNYSRGYYRYACNLIITASDPSATVKYTLDCSDPLSNNGIEYTSSLLVNTTTIVRAVALSSTDTSELITQTYLFPEDIRRQPKHPNGFPATWGGSKTINADYEMDPEVVNNPVYSDKIEAALKSLPALSLTMETDEWFDPESGLYVGYPNTNITREKPVSAEFIYSDPNESFLINCGVQNQGGTSIVDWKSPKQSMRLLFKSQYGPKKLKKRLFPDSEIESINTLVVDGLLYSWIHPWDNLQRKTSLYFRDQLASDLQNEMGGLSFHGIYVNVYINGLYWGIYDLHERPDEDFMAEYYDAQTEDFDIVKHNPNTVVAGSNTSYLNLLKEARKGFTENTSLDEIKKLLDLPRFIDYMILNFYLGNYDWAHQNYYAAVNKNLNSGYRFYTWDAEHVMRYSDVNYNNTDKNDSGGPTEIHQLLKNNAEYRLMFADAFYKHAFNNGALTPENFEHAFNKRKNELDQAIILESARWGDYLESSTNTVYTRDDFWIPEVNKDLTEYIPNRINKVLDQFRQNNNRLFPSVMPPVFNKEEGIIESGATVSVSDNNSVPGIIIYTLDGTDPREEGGSIRGTEYKAPVTINTTTTIKARFLSTETNEWSALAEAGFIPESDYNAIMISEIMYNSGYQDLEFIELLNNGKKEINIKGYTFTDGIEYTFDNDLIINPGATTVLANDKTMFSSLFSFDPYDTYSKRLSNDGETILLANSFGDKVDSVTYSNAYPWPWEADGHGRSLVLRDPDSDNAEASNWELSAEIYGSPGDFTSVNTGTNTIKNSVYPNPFKNRIRISINDTGQREILSFGIYNSMGQLVKSFHRSAHEHLYEFDLSSLNTGTYLLIVSDDASRDQLVNMLIVKIE
ncbi:CotH kinase family protein [Saccharicrinis sp. FJH54]|uniref:CotH kinase family protein n=1 Tax=Saccharicrinis sp. FJH54 TaxID=3344665 RepID=UPI0035D4F7E5